MAAPGRTILLDVDTEHPAHGKRDIVHSIERNQLPALVDMDIDRKD